MNYPFIGSEAVAAGALSKSTLRSQYTRVFPDVYLSRASDRTAVTLAAAALLGANWVDADSPVELIHSNRNAPVGIAVHSDRTPADEIMTLDGMAFTTPERTALDLGCWYPLAPALASLDALAAATQIDLARVAALADRYPGRRGIRTARRALSLVDGGAQSPRETWLRLLLIEAGFPRPQTQLPVGEGAGRAIAYLDMGWEELKVAVEYDGEQHRTDRRQYIWDVRRRELLDQLGWIVVRVVVGDRREDIVRRVREAIGRRASHQSDIRRSA
ncbi:MAG: DUF559 domain-containing protein [Mycobacterium sp.]|nr:DUF559 domain-containing protein [Mycobacterium sp.]